jgi:hypothetical protein
MDIVSSTDGDRADFPRLGTRYLLRGDATDGRFALVEHEIPPRALAAPTHMHRHEDESSFVLEGRVGVQIGDEESVAGPGGCVGPGAAFTGHFWRPSARRFPSIDATVTAVESIERKPDDHQKQATRGQPAHCV